MVMAPPLTTSATLTALPLAPLNSKLTSSVPLCPPGTVLIAELSLAAIVVVTLLAPGFEVKASNPPPLMPVMVTIIVSAGSARVSSIVDISKLAVVLFAGIVTVVTPVKSLPSIAVPL